MSNKNAADNESSAGRIDYKDPEVLERLYHGKGLTLKEIGDRAGVSDQTIHRWLKKHGIETRSRGEAQRKFSRVEYATYYTTGAGYHAWKSTWCGKQAHVRVHRLLAVAEYGFDAVCEKHVHHKNEIKWLNYGDNIELMEPGEHMRHHNHGEGCGNAELTESEAGEVKRLAEEGTLSQKEIGERFGIGQHQVSRIKSGKRWSHLD